MPVPSAVVPPLPPPPCCCCCCCCCCVRAYSAHCAHPRPLRRLLAPAEAASPPGGQKGTPGRTTAFYNYLQITKLLSPVIGVA